MRKNLNSLKENNKGFTLASMLIIMLIVSVLAALLLTITVLNVQSKQVDQKSKETFYLAESIVDEIRAGIESELGEALGTAYKEALPNLNGNIDQLESDYAKRIVSILFKTYTKKDYTEAYSNNSGYQIDVLQAYLSDKNKDNIKSVKLSSGDKAYVFVESNFSKLILKDVHIAYTTTDGYQSRMQMDFVIQVPNTRFENPGFYLTLGDYSIITDDYLTNNQALKSTISGSVYAGEGIVSRDEGSKLIISADNIVTRKTIASESGGTIEIKGLDEACSVWADTIKTATSIINPTSELLTKITIKNGKIYVKNDLVLDARNNYVSIQGSYFGFGNNKSVPDESSAILINGRKSTLDLTGISNMMLAGRAYIDADPNNPKNGVLLGESLSVKGNQVAYLVPGEYVRGGSNPTTNLTNLGAYDIELDFRPDESRDFSNSNNSYKNYIDAYKAMYDGKEDEEIENGSILQYLNLNNSTVGYKKIITHNKAGQLETYYYLEFRSEKLANKYFNEYYAANKDRIDERTRLYVDSIKLNEDLVDAYTIVGNLLSYDNNKKEANVVYREEPDSVVATSNLYKKQYNEMIYNLYVSGSVGETTENSSLFDKYIDSTKFKLPDTGPEVFELDSNTKAIFVDNPSKAFSIKSQFLDPNKASGIIVATGEVEVDSNFEGTIISKGGIKFVGSNQLTADKYTVYQLLSPSNPDVIKYFKELDSSMASGSGGSEQKINIHELVGVENWKKY